MDPTVGRAQYRSYVFSATIMLMKRFLNRALRILLINDTLVLIASAMIVPIYAVYVDDIGGDILDAGLAAGIFAVVAGFAVLVTGRIADRSRHKGRILAAGYLLSALGFLLYIFVDSIWQLLAVQALVGLAQAIIAPVFDALYTEHIGGKKRASSRWSMWESAYYFAVAIGAAGGALIVKLTSFDVLFIVMAAMCLCSGLVILSRSKRIL
jgi:MFS family permease